LLQKSERIRFLPEPVLSVNTKIPRFARNDKSEGVEMTKWLVYCHFDRRSAEKSSKVGLLQEAHLTFPLQVYYFLQSDNT
ncbi:hypothetical protein M1N77_02075, partial [Thermodesulfovibrionales bacterium]|nr:hypothetical protein [Thermodesulfovibrionales bacterium]